MNRFFAALFLLVLSGAAQAQAPVGMWCFTGASQFASWGPCSLSALTRPSASFTRPTDTNAYTIGDLVANNTAAGSVTAMSFTLTQANSGGGVFIRRVIIQKTTTGVTAPNFRLHLYTTSPTIANGDNAAYSTTSVGWFCDVDVNMYTTTPFSDGSGGIGAPNSGAECAVIPTSSIVYGLLEARGAYAPGNAEVFTVFLEVY